MPEIRGGFQGAIFTRIIIPRQMDCIVRVGKEFQIVPPRIVPVTERKIRRDTHLPDDEWAAPELCGKIMERR